MAHKSLEEQLQGLFSELEEILKIDEPSASSPEADQSQADTQSQVQDHTGEVDEASPASDNPLVTPEEALTLPVDAPPQLQEMEPAPNHREKPPLPAWPAAPLATLPNPPVWPSAPAVEPRRVDHRSGINWRLIIWGVMITAALFSLITLGQELFFVSPEDDTLVNRPRFVVPLSPTPSATPSSMPLVVETPVTFVEPTSTPTPVAGGQILVITPRSEDAGWVVSNEGDEAPGNHFGDAFLYAGHWAGQTFHAAIQFDLSQLPRGAKIYAASLRLTGSKADQLSQSGEGEWELHLLDAPIDYRWPSHTYEEIHHASSLAVISPRLSQEQLAVGTVNLFEFKAEQLALLERRLLESTADFGRTVSFRLDGPAGVENNLFAWDSGHDPAGTGFGPELFISVGPPPAITPPPYYVLVTSTPTPVDIFAAATTALRLTAEAERLGTATPLPPNWVTPFAVTATPTPENRLTAQAMHSFATAVALTTGEPANKVTATPTPTYKIITSTPTPPNILTAVADALRTTAEAAEIGTPTPLPANWVTPVVVTVTPTPENTATMAYLNAALLTTGTPTPAPGNVQTATSTPTYVIITSTPTPVELMTAVANSIQQTAEASRFGAATPLPTNWVTPVVVTLSPTPANEATASYLQAVALVMGTPTPTPANLQTATPTPVLVFVESIISPTATATPSATPQAIPEMLVGKILFLSDREGATAEELQQAAEQQRAPKVAPRPYVFDPETGQLARLTDIWPYQVVAAREGWSADGNYQTYTQQLLWTNVRTERGNVPTEVLAIHYYDYIYHTEHIVSRMGSGIVYDPVWSPVSDEIAFVATENGNDEIWLIRRDGSEPRQLTQNQWEWDKHPSWSPTGQQLVFYSNRTGNRQLWIMNKDGSEPRLLMAPNPYNDWDPVWVKTAEPPPPLVRLPDWRFIKPAEEQPGGP